jgi:hypothetical protein
MPAQILEILVSSPEIHVFKMLRPPVACVVMAYAALQLANIAAT